MPITWKRVPRRPTSVPPPLGPTDYKYIVEPPIGESVPLPTWRGRMRVPRGKPSPHIPKNIGTYPL